MTQFFVAAHGLIEKDGKYLVTHRSAINDYKPLTWDIPGGTVDAGELVEEALMREIKEEANLLVKIIQPLFVYSNKDSVPEKQYFQIVFSCRYISGDIKLNPEEHDEYRWVTKEEIGSFELIPFLQEFLKNEHRDN